jgi:hypothetical protein
MKCPICQAETKVLDSRGVRRRRECIDCLTRFSTYETLINESMDNHLKEQMDPKANEPFVYKPTGKGRWTKSESDFLVTQYIEGIPRKEIAKALNRSLSVVWHQIGKLRKQGVLD